MNFEHTPATLVEPATSPENGSNKSPKELFLGEQSDLISDDAHAWVATVMEEKTRSIHEAIGSTEGKRLATYDKYKKAFMIDGQKATMGQVVAARHLGIVVGLPAGFGNSGDEKKLKKLMIERQTNDALYEELNRELASALATKTRREDLFISKAYEAIAARSGVETTQPGIFAENIMIGVAESIAIDRPDLGITVMPANAYQDVHDKIDFIIATTKKRRGVGVDAADLPQEKKSVGVQFTINTDKAAHKADQIAKAKERGVNVDDIVYVAIESAVLRQAIKKWQDAGKPIAGPWAYLSSEIRTATLKGLFHGVLDEEQEKSLLKNE